MAGKPLAKKTLSELSRRGGAEYVREWLLEGKSLRDLASDLDVSRGYFNNLMLKNEDYTRAIDAARKAAADAHFEAGFEAISDLSHRRQREVMEALGGDRDVSEANVSQIDLGLLKQKVGQHNLAAQAYNPERYGTRNQQNVQINIGDLHLDALRKMKVVQGE